MFIRPKLDHQRKVVKEYEYLDLDNEEGEAEGEQQGGVDRDAWGAHRAVVATTTLKRAPRDVEVAARETRNVTLNWIEDDCAKAYLVELHSNNGEGDVA